ncbi:MAG: sugar transferase, partial [Thermodesulfobacteriota bacterium]|nr:sugar transferase [Thermodesulfobacteriota bacterium]
MLKGRKEIIVLSHKLVDIFLTAAAFIGAYLIKKYLLPEPFRGLAETPNYYIILLLVIILWYVLFSLFNLYASYRRRTYAQIFWNMIMTVSTGMIVIAFFMFVFKIADVSRIMMGLFFLLNIGLLAISKWIVYKTLVRSMRKGINIRNILIIGYKERAKDVINVIEKNASAGYKILGCLDISKDAINKEIKNGIHVIGTVDHLEKILREEVVDELIFAMPLKEIGDIVKYIVMAKETGIMIRIIPDWYLYNIMYLPEIGPINFEPFLKLPTMVLAITQARQEELIIKSTSDYIFAGIVMVLAIPLFLVISCAIKLSSKGPILFKQKRYGLNGRSFLLYKFRTMVVDAETKRQELEALNETDGPVFKIKKDPRIIPFVGTLLRKISLDELPQLINVLKGEMSIIGPRPPIPAEVKEYEIWQIRRLSMKPGITGLWQCTPRRNEVSFEDWVKMDLSYIDDWSLWLDFKIML